MTTYPFLSPEWIDAARTLYNEDRTSSEGNGDGGPPAVTMNLVVTDVPFGSGSVEAYVDSTDGVFKIELGSLENAEVKLTLNYNVARAVFIDGDSGAGMRAFLTGKIRVEGNMAKLLALQTARSTPAETATREKVRAITQS